MIDKIMDSHAYELKYEGVLQLSYEFLTAILVAMEVDTWVSSLHDRSVIPD